MRRSSALLAAAAIIAAATACSSGSGSTQGTTSSSSSTSSSPIKVGMIAPLTGPFAPLGQGDEQGAEIAVSQLNAAGGIGGHKVDLIIKDDKTDPTQSLIDFQAVAGQGVAAVLGSSVSDSARAVAPKAEQAQIPYISLSPVDQTVNPVQPYVFLVPAVTTTYATRLMQWFKAEGITKIAVGYDNTDIYTTNGYRGQPSEFAADAYSGAELLFAALKQAAPGFSASALQSALNHLSLLTPDGKYNYTATDHSGLTPDDVAMVVVQNGAFQPTPWQKTQFSTLPG